MAEYIPRYGEDSLGVIFQGQNVNYAGMGRLLNKFVAGQKIYDLANEILDFDVRAVSFGNRTHLQEYPQYVQPAIVTAELAEYRIWEDFNDGAVPDLVTGLSLGMYAALAAAKAAEDATVIDISAQRGKIVGKNAKWRPGGMVNIKGLPNQDALDDLISRTKTGIAIRWSKFGLVTLSGTKARVRKAHIIANGFDGVTAEISKAKEGAHHAIQKRTQKPLVRALGAADLGDPQIDLLSNDPRKDETVFLTKVAEIIRHYADQMTEPVDMIEVNTEIALSGIARILEIGPDLGHGLTSQIIRKCREEDIEGIRKQMGRGVVKPVKFDYGSLAPKSDSLQTG